MTLTPERNLNTVQANHQTKQLKPNIIYITGHKTVPSNLYFSLLLCRKIADFNTF